MSAKCSHLLVSLLPWLGRLALTVGRRFNPATKLWPQQMWSRVPWLNVFMAWLTFLSLGPRNENNLILVSFSEHITGVDNPVISRPVEITFLPVTSEMCSTVTNTSTLVRKRGVAYPILVDQQPQTAASRTERGHLKKKRHFFIQLCSLFDSVRQCRPDWRWFWQQHCPVPEHKQNLWKDFFFFFFVQARRNVMETTSAECAEHLCLWKALTEDPVLICSNRMTVARTWVGTDLAWLISPGTATRRRRRSEAHRLWIHRL